jgi:hypothetical protein
MTTLDKWDDLKIRLTRAPALVPDVLADDNRLCYKPPLLAWIIEEAEDSVSRPGWKRIRYEDREIAARAVGIKPSSVQRELKSMADPRRATIELYDNDGGDYLVRPTAYGEQCYLEGVSAGRPR